jgi:hypothetical protein
MDLIAKMRVAGMKRVRKQRKVKDLTGLISGRLTALSVAERTKYGAKWLCRCECGNKVAVLSTHLQSKSTKSCGCIQRGWGKRNEAAIRAGQKRGSVNSKRYLTLEDALSKDPLALLARFVAGLKGDACAPV